MTTSQSKNIFDYIVVGTGPAGAVITKTLTVNKKTSVLVLDTGQNNDNNIPIKDSCDLPNGYTIAKHLTQDED
ncbi:hypothetical protein P4670_05300 [Neobacillus cucumis]|nr:hypothetical protein [Neobacillus cucumis]